MPNKTTYILLFLTTFLFLVANEKLIKYTDKIFYNNGLYDKLYYDSSLINNKIIDLKKFNVKFTFFDLELTDIHSIFYFKEDIKNLLTYIGLKIKLQNFYPHNHKLTSQQKDYLRVLDFW